MVGIFGLEMLTLGMRRDTDGSGDLGRSNTLIVVVFAWIDVHSLALTCNRIVDLKINVFLVRV